MKKKQPNYPVQSFAVYQAHSLPLKLILAVVVNKSAEQKRADDPLHSFLVFCEMDGNGVI